MGPQTAARLQCVMQLPLLLPSACSAGTCACHMPCGAVAACFPFCGQPFHPQDTPAVPCSRASTHNNEQCATVGVPIDHVSSESQLQIANLHGVGALEGSAACCCPQMYCTWLAHQLLGVSMRLFFKGLLSTLWLESSTLAWHCGLGCLYLST